MVSKEMVKVAKLLVGIDFDTPEQLKTYLKNHPGADKSKHKVVIKTKSPTTKEDSSGKSDSPTSPVTQTEKTDHGFSSGLHIKKKAVVGALSKVSNIMSAHGINEDSDEVGELAGFKSTLGQRVPEKDVGKWYVRNSAKLKKDFIANMNQDNYPSGEAFNDAKSRISKMPITDFAKLLASVMNDDEEEM